MKKTKTLCRHLFSPGLYVALGAALFIMTMACTTACESEALDGDWDPIKTDRSAVHFSRAGGRDTIRLLNYSSWWMDQLDVRVGDTTVHHYPNYEGTIFSMKGEWYSLVIPEEHRNLLVIELTENARPDFPRELTIGVTVGDSFATLRVTQATQ